MHETMKGGVSCPSDLEDAKENGVEWINILVSLADVGCNDKPITLSVPKYPFSDDTSWFESYDTLLNAIGKSLSDASWHKDVILVSNGKDIDKLEDFIHICRLHYQHGKEKNKPIILRVTVSS